MLESIWEIRPSLIFCKAWNREPWFFFSKNCISSIVSSLIIASSNEKYSLDKNILKEKGKRSDEDCLPCQQHEVFFQLKKKWQRWRCTPAPPPMSEYTPGKLPLHLLQPSPSLYLYLSPFLDSFLFIEC